MSLSSTCPMRSTISAILQRKFLSLRRSSRTQISASLTKPLACALCESVTVTHSHKRRRRRRAHANESTSESSATTTRGMEAMRSVSSSPSVCLSCHHSRTNKSNNKVKEWKEARRRREREYLCLSREMFFFSLCLSLSLFVRSTARNTDR